MRTIINQNQYSTAQSINYSHKSIVVLLVERERHMQKNDAKSQKTLCEQSSVKHIRTYTTYVLLLLFFRCTNSIYSAASVK